MKEKKIHRLCVDPTTKAKVLDALIGQAGEADRVRVAVHPKVKPGTLRRLSQDPSAAVRVGVAGNARTPEDVLAILRTDMVAQVRTAARRNAAKPADAENLGAKDLLNLLAGASMLAQGTRGVGLAGNMLSGLAGSSSIDEKAIRKDERRKCIEAILEEKKSCLRDDEDCPLCHGIDHAVLRLEEKDKSSDWEALAGALRRGLETAQDLWKTTGQTG